MLAALAACAPVAAVAPPPPPDPAASMPALEQRIFALVEDTRLKLDPKAKALAPDRMLAQAARAHSADMAAKNYLGHKGPDSKTAVDFVMEADADFQGIIGENIAAQHFVAGYPLDVDALAHRFVESWTASKSHKDNLAFAAYDRSGVGAAVSGDTIYVTQLFATDLGLPPVKGDPKSRPVTQFPDAQAARDAPQPPAATSQSPQR